MADSKKLSFSTSPKAEQFPPKFYGLVLRLAGLIDAKGIDVAQPTLHSCNFIIPMLILNFFFFKKENSKLPTQKRAVGQPDGHIG